MRKIFLIVLLLLMGMYAGAASYYVDYGAANDDGIGTEGDPWKYCPGDARSGNSLADGDTVYFELGQTYSGTGSGNVITTTQPNLTFTVDAGFGAGTAIFDGPSNENFFYIQHSGCSILGLTTSYEIKFQGANLNRSAILVANPGGSAITGGTFSYLEFDSISSSSGTEGIGIKIGVGDYASEVSNITVSYCYFHDCRSYGVKASAGAGSTHDCNIHHNIFTDNGVLSLSRIQANVSSSLGNGAYDIEVYNNTFTDTGVGVLDGIEFNNSPNKLYNNVFDGHGYSAIFDPAYNSNKSGIIEVYGNIFKNSVERGFNIGRTSTAEGYLKAYNNLFINNGDYVLNFMATADDNEFYSNTFYQTGGHTIWLQNGAAGNIFKNNIVYSTGAVYEQAGGTYGTNIEDYNCFFRNAGDIIIVSGTGFDKTELAVYKAAAAPNGQNTLFSDPLLTSVPTDLTLTGSSPAKDVGETLGSPYDLDILGVSRPQGSAYDMGAYEYVGLPPPPVTGPFASDLVMVLSQFLMIPIIQYLLGLWGFAAFAGMIKVINKYL